MFLKRYTQKIKKLNKKRCVFLLRIYLLYEYKSFLSVIDTDDKDFSYTLFHLSMPKHQHFYNIYFFSHAKHVCLSVMDLLYTQQQIYRFLRHTTRGVEVSLVGLYNYYATYLIQPINFYIKNYNVGHYRVLKLFLESFEVYIQNIYLTPSYVQFKRRHRRIKKHTAKLLLKI